MLALSEIEMIMPFKNFSTMYGFYRLKQEASIPSPLLGLQKFFLKTESGKRVFPRAVGAK